MKFLADESVDQPIVARLRADGHDVVYVAELSPGISDSAVLASATAQERVLLTADKDFGDLVYRQKKPAFGIILFRVTGLPSEHKASLASEVVKDHGPEFVGKFAVVSSALIRIKRMQLPG